jgi:tRNA (guanine37-N1)-methyltransferase
MRIDVLTLFPEMVRGVCGESILARAQAAGLIEIVVTDIRDHSSDPHRKVDDRPFGGGPGMVLTCQPVFDAVAAVEAADPRPATRILLTPQGERFSQRIAAELAGCQRLLLIAGHYEGFDERIRVGLSPREISIGDYVLTGGELPAMVVADAVARLVPGVLGAEDAHAFESFSDGLLEYPQYTRPREYRGMEVPEELLCGHHARIEAWRLEQAELRTKQRRPDIVGGSDAK